MKISNFFNFITETVVLVAVALAIVLPIRFFLFQPFIVHGASMEPNFHSGDYLIIDEISYSFEEPQRGDVIVFNYPLDPRYRYIKRIIGLPGETIEIENGQILITPKDGEQFIYSETEYLDQELLNNWIVYNSDTKIQLEDDEYFVLGDNRNASSDSRRWGTLPEEYITGKVFLRFSLAEIFSQ